MKKGGQRLFASFESVASVATRPTEFPRNANLLSVLDDYQFLFIIGAPRSGTTMLQVLLGCHPRVATTIELTLFDRYISPWLEVWAKEQGAIDRGARKQGLPMIWSREELDIFLREFLTRAYQKVIDRNSSATHLLDKHPGYSLHVESIKRLLPKARFVHLIRDGRDVACSLRAARANMGFGFQYVEQSADLWNQWVHAARKAAQFGEDYLEVRYEEFLADRPKWFSRILEFCRLPAEEKWIAETLEQNTFDKMKERHPSGDASVQLPKQFYRRGKPGAWQEEFSVSDRYAFDRLAGVLLRELGYDKENWWAANSVEQTIEPIRYEISRFISNLRQAAKVAFPASNRPRP